MFPACWPSSPQEEESGKVRLRSGEAGEALSSNPPTGPRGRRVGGVTSATPLQTRQAGPRGESASSEADPRAWIPWEYERSPQFLCASPGALFPLVHSGDANATLRWS